MICEECDQLMQSFQQTVLNYIAHVHYLHWLIDVEHYPYQYEKERLQERKLETALHDAMEELNHHWGIHRQENIIMPEFPRRTYKED